MCSSDLQIGSSFALRGSYVAVKGTHLLAGDATNWNQVDPKYLALGNLLNANINSAQAQVAGFREPFAGFSDLWGTRASVAQALRPYPQFAALGVALHQARDGRKLLRRYLDEGRSALLEPAQEPHRDARLEKLADLRKDGPSGKQAPGVALEEGGDAPVVRIAAYEQRDQKACIKQRDARGGGT